MGKQNKLRRKKGIKKVKVGIRKKKITEKASMPIELRLGHGGLLIEKLDLPNNRADWIKEDTMMTNYTRNGLLTDPNKSMGRNKHMNHYQEEAHVIREEARVKDGKLEMDHGDDDELRAANNLVRKTGAALPKRLTSHQKTIVEQFMKKHGDDVKAMTRDIKLNRMQQTESQLRSLIESYQYWGTNTSVDFRVKIKGL